MSLPYGPPYPVSPLIRGLRCALFVAGFFYARTKQAYYKETERVWQEEEAKRKVVRDREMAIRRAKILAEEQQALKDLEAGKF